MCNKELKEQHRLFCSNNCSNKYRKKYHPHRGGIYKKCIFCGKEFYNRHGANKKFCVQECYNKARKTDKKYTSNYNHFKKAKCYCFGCGKEIYLHISKIKVGKKYCNQKCYYNHIKKYEELASNYKMQTIERECLYCKKRFKTTYKENKIYCSMRCYHKDPASPNRQYGSSNAMAKEENRTKVRTALLKYIKENNCGAFNYMIGKNEKEILDDIEEKQNIKIERHYEICGFIVDGYCKELNIAFEVDESYHKYQKEKDKKREEIIKKELNCDFIRINDYGDGKYDDVSIRA